MNRWKLVASEWDEVLAILESMLAAERDAGDVDTLTMRLKSLSPKRIQAIGPAVGVPTPDEIQDRLNRLVRSLGGHTDSDEETDGSTD